MCALVGVLVGAPVKGVDKEVTRTVTSTTTLVPGAPVTTTVTITPTTITATTPTTPTRKAIRMGLDAVGTAENMIGSLVAEFMRSVFPTSAPEIPVHPGLAKLLKEYGVWKDSWKVAS